MHLYLDTEFTTLAPGRRLISIALVDEDENYFYAELTDTYTLDHCSDFVKTEVLPLLRGEPYKMTEYECSFAIGNWIENRNCECIIATDAPSWDLPFLAKLLDPLWPVNLPRDGYQVIRVDGDIETALVKKFNYAVHNALDDALVMKKASLGY